MTDILFVSHVSKERDHKVIDGLGYLPICAQTSSVKAPMNCGVALTPNLRVSSSTILPMENQRADLSRC